MKTIILFPADLNDIRCVDRGLKNEYDTVLTLVDFIPVLFNYDMFLKGEELKIYPDIIDGAVCIYRGWMLNATQHEKLFYGLSKRNIMLINSPEQYKLCHIFPNVYPYIREYTPRSIWFGKGEDIDINKVKSSFDRFMIKDYVKSVKGTNFPKFFTSEIASGELTQYITDFIRLRSTLYTGGIVFKEYVDLKLYDGKPNEYRVFYFKSNIISVSRNSNQNDLCPVVNDDFVRKFNGLKSNFYTIDFAELSNGEWIIIETGDGQVSGLSPNQYIYKFYEELSLVI